MLGQFKAFKSSFLVHYPDSSPSVSAIPTSPELVPTLPDDSPEVHFVSRVVIAHVDTGATVMVSNVHGAMPTKAHCRTAMTGSWATIDATGTWMINLVGSTNGNNLSLALCGTTQITDLQC
jgi:hypothetical protein